MKNKFLILWMLSSVLLAACDEVLTPYNVDTCWLGFDMENSADTLVYRTFIYSGPQAETDTVWIPLKTIGKVVDYDRPVKLVQLPVEDSCAVAGKHFVAFDDPEMLEHLKIPKGSVRKSFPLIVLRDPSLELEEVRIELKIGENEYFRSGIDEWTNFVVKTTSMAVKPTNWDSYWKYYFGITWGSVKMKFIIDNTGFTEFDGGSLSSDYTNYLSSKVKQKLLEYNTNHPDEPLSEADGTLVTFE